MPESERPLSPAAFSTFGELLVFLRKRAHMSQRELALNVGYHYSHISRLENNIHIPDANTVRALFIPALGLQYEPEWSERLMELAQSAQKDETGRTPPTAASEGISRGLPISLTSIIGRETEAGSIRELIRNPAIRVVTLVGPPGVGKTRLAIHVAEKSSGDFRDGAVFVDLTSIKQAGEVVPEFARAMGIEDIVEQTLVKTLLNLLRVKNVLVLMDNFEQVVDAAPQLIPLLAGAPDIKILTTSREALRIDGEFEFPVRPLPVPEQAATESPSVQLFLERARAVKPDFALTEENASRVAEICQRLDGLPLAIELAAARVNILSPAAMLDQFNRRFDWLSHSRNDSPAWRRTLSGAIEWSHQLLSEPERALFERLSVFESGWTLHAAEQVCRDATICKQSDVLNLLLSLADRSLVATESQGDATRYHFLATIQHYARKNLEASGILEWQGKHLGHFADWAEGMAGKMTTLSPIQFRHAIEKEDSNIRAALEHARAAAGHTRHGLRLVSAICTIWLKLSHFKQALDWVNTFLPYAEGPELLPYRARLLYLHSALSYWRDDLAQGLTSNFKAEQAAREVGDKKLLADILYYRGGSIYREQNELSKASASLEESIELCRSENHHSRLSIALTGLGLVLGSLNRSTEADSAIQEALKISTDIQDVWGQSYALRGRAEIYRTRGEHEKALAAYKEALQASLGIDDRVGAGMTLANMALTSNLLEDHPASNEYARSALDLFRAIGNEYQQPFPLRMMGYAALHSGDGSRARELCKASLMGNQEVGSTIGVLACLTLLAEIHLAEGNTAGSAQLAHYIKNQIAMQGLKLMEPDQKAMGRLENSLPASPSVTYEELTLDQILYQAGF